MRELYECIRNRNRYSVNLVLTVLDGKFCGEKAFCTAGKIIWNGETNGFLKVHKDIFENLKNTQICEIEGVRVFVERVGSEEELIVCGGGHVSLAIVRMAVMLGFSVTVIEDRPEFANHIRRIEGVRVLCDSFEHAMQEIEGNENTYFVIVTRGHRYDQLCLEKAIVKPNAYIGMMGSRRRVMLVKKALETDGIDSGKLDKVHTPIGLDIGAETPEEIAVAVMAELIQVKNRRKCVSSYSDNLLDMILSANEDAVKADVKAQVLATIVSRKGSAPRGIGTKMLITENGKTFDTIGGGCAEARVIQKARQMMAVKTHTPILYQVDMTGREAEDEGMVCGGVVEVMLECV